MIYDSNFGDPNRMDRRAPYVGEHQLHINPQAAKDLGINDGDYVHVDANPADRPYRSWRSDDELLPETFLQRLFDGDLFVD